MNSVELESLRICLLQQLRAIGQDSDLPLSTLHTGARLAGHRDLPEAQLRGELVYLLDKQLVAVAPRALSPENKRWRLTAAGRDVLAEAGL